MAKFGQSNGVDASRNISTDEQINTSTNFVNYDIALESYGLSVTVAPTPYLT